MAFRLYVGNYPCSFTKEDIENLFRDFDGIKVDKVLGSKSKSFSFLCCKDIDQLVSVIKKMNRRKVSGRNLIVRASDVHLQEYVDLILQNDESSSSEKAVSSHSEAPFVPVQVMRNKCRQPHGKSDSEKSANTHIKSDVNDFRKNFNKSYEDSEFSANKSTCTSRFMQDNHQHKQDASDGAFANDSSLLSKAPNKINNQRGPGSNNESLKNNTHSSKSPLNSYPNVGDCASANDSSLLSKTPNKVNNQRSPRNNYESPKNNIHSSKNSLNSFQNFSDENDHEYFETNHSSGSLQKSYRQSTKHINDDFTGYTSPKSHAYGQPKYESYDQIKTNNNCYSGYSYNSTSDSDSQASRDTGYFSQQRDSSSPTWISVTNFRIHTSAEALYELFSDYNPLTVRMICNVPRKDKTLCEAHICFPSKDIADDVILNFDNTIFEGRIILVNDVEDLTMINELLNLSH